MTNDNRKKGITISLILALLFTGAIVFGANKNYAAATKTIDTVVAGRYIPSGKYISQDDIKTEKVPEKLAGNLVQKPDAIIGKTASVSLIAGQYIWKDSITKGEGKRQGYVEVFVPTDLPSSACLIAGEMADIYVVDQGYEGAPGALPLYKGARVLNSLEQSGNEIDPAQRNQVTEMAANGSKVPVTIGVEVPEKIASALVQACSDDSVYLVKSDKLPKKAL
ncbi:SAF domain-containing protein [Desulfoscipio gibsoniae]